MTAVLVAVWVFLVVLGAALVLVSFGGFHQWHVGRARRWPRTRRTYLYQPIVVLVLGFVLIGIGRAGLLS